MRAVVTPERKKDVVALSFLAAVTTLLYADVLFGPSRFFIRDLTRYYYPTKRIVREVILSGDFPSWNPYYSAGQPMAANPEYEVFYPPQWLILLPSYDLGFRLHIIVHIYIAVFGMYLLLRSSKLTAEAATFGAIVFGLAGPMTSMVNLLPILFVVAWIPLVFYFLRRLLKQPNARDFALCALVLGIQILAGEPTSLVQTWTLIGFYVLYRSVHDGSDRLRLLLRNGLIATSLLLCSVSVGAAQLIPAIDHVGDSVRSRGFDFSLVTSWSMPPVRPLELVFPNIFGHVYRDGSWYWAGGLYKAAGSPFIFSIYPGFLATCLVAAAFAVRPRGARFVLGLTALSVVLALGRFTPLYRWLYDAGIAQSIRYPEKFLLMALFVFGVLAAVMLDRGLRGDRRVFTAGAGVALASLLFASGVGAFGFFPQHDELFTDLWNLSSRPSAERMADMTHIDWLVAAGRGGIVLTLLLGLRSGSKRPLWTSAALILTVADLVPVQREVLPRLHRAYFTPPPIEKTLARDKQSYRIFHEPDWYGTSQIARSYFGTGRAVYWVVRNGIFPMTPATWGFRTVLERDYDKTALLATADLSDAMWAVRDRGQKAWREIFMAMSNARYRAEYKPFQPERKRVGNAVASIQPIRFTGPYRNPRYYFADQLVPISGREEFIRSLVARRWNWNVAFVTTPQHSPPPARPLARGTVETVRERSNQITLTVRAAGEAFLVLAVTPHRYWRATIDGRTVPLQVTNIGYQGLHVPPGRHRVELIYRNGIVERSVIVSLIAGIAMLIAAVSPFGRANSDVSNE